MALSHYNPNRATLHSCIGMVWEPDSAPAPHIAVPIIVRGCPVHATV